MSDDIKPLNTAEASKNLWDKWHYKISQHTLETYRSRGGGPTYFEIGVNRFYWPADLDAWVLSRMTPKVGSVSEARQLRLARRKLIEDESKPCKPDPSNSETPKAPPNTKKKRKPALQRAKSIQPK
jgi:hypothetical protein